MAFGATLTHANDRTGLIVMTSFFIPLTVIAVVLRFNARRLTKVGLGADDWLALVALVFVLVLNGIFLSATIQGAITGHSPVVNNWPVTTDLELLVQKYKYAFQTVEKLTFGLVKLSILYLWKRIFARSRPFIIFCWVMIVIVAAWSLAFFFATVFQCGTRWELNWAPIGIFLTECIESLNALTVFTVTDIFTDFVILFMPVPLIWQLRMPTKKKVGVTSVFMIGLFTIAAGIVRMYMYLVTSYDKENNPDFIADFTLCILWSEIEANVAMLVCCMPTLAPVIGKCRDAVSPYIRSTAVGKWILLSSDKPGSKNTTDYTGRSAASMQEDSFYPDRPASNKLPWQGSQGTVTAAARSEPELRLGHNSGIVAHTEISTTFEMRNIYGDKMV